MIICDCESGKIYRTRTFDANQSDLTKAQKWIDYDMKHYGHISETTRRDIKRMGLRIEYDDGEYEVTDSCGKLHDSIYDWDTWEELEKEYEKYKKSGRFNSNQLKEIWEGLKNRVDISKYADPKFDSMQMQLIREGLEKGLTISFYADPRFDWEQMLIIFQALDEELVFESDIPKFANPKFNSDQMVWIRSGLMNGVDVSKYADPKYTDDEMKRIMNQLIHSKYYDSKPKRHLKDNFKPTEDWLIDVLGYEELYIWLSKWLGGWKLKEYLLDACQDYGLNYDDDNGYTDLSKLDVDELGDFVIDALGYEKTYEEIIAIMGGWERDDFVKDVVRDLEADGSIELDEQGLIVDSKRNKKCRDNVRKNYNPQTNIVKAWAKRLKK